MLDTKFCQDCTSKYNQSTDQIELNNSVKGVIVKKINKIIPDQAVSSESDEDLHWICYKCSVDDLKLH